MPKFGCRCGYVMLFHTGEEPYDLMLVPEKKIGDVISMFTNQSINADSFVEEIDTEGLQVMRCPQCDRLWVEEGVRAKSFCSYIREQK